MNVEIPCFYSYHIAKWQDTIVREWTWTEFILFCLYFAVSSPNLNYFTNIVFWSKTFSNIFFYFVSMLTLMLFLFSVHVEVEAEGRGEKKLHIESKKCKQLRKYFFVPFFFSKWFSEQNETIPSGKKCHFIIFTLFILFHQIRLLSAISFYFYFFFSSLKCLQDRWRRACAEWIGGKSVDKNEKVSMCYISVEW